MEVGVRTGDEWPGLGAEGERGRRRTGSEKGSAGKYRAVHGKEPLDTHIGEESPTNKGTDSEIVGSKFVWVHVQGSTVPTGPHAQVRSVPSLCLVEGPKGAHPDFTRFVSVRPCSPPVCARRPLSRPGCVRRPLSRPPSPPLCAYEADMTRDLRHGEDGRPLAPGTD